MKIHSQYSVQWDRMINLANTQVEMANDGGASVDLNLVKVFVAIFETRSLTLASQRLFVSQSAVSQALSRLRDSMGDVLFERVGREMRPTPIAESVSDQFRASLTLIDRAMDGVHGFDPNDSERTFRIALSELGEIGWLPDIVRRLHAEAPQVRLETVALNVETLPDALSRGVIDLAVTPAQLPDEFQRRHVKRETYSVIMSTAHPCAALPLTASVYRSAIHIAVASDSGAALLISAQKRSGFQIDPLVTVHHFATLPRLISESRELVATIPDTLASGWAATWPLAVKNVPFLMLPIELNLYRRRATHHSAAIDWAYAAVGQALTGSEGEFSALQVAPNH